MKHFRLKIKKLIRKIGIFEFLIGFLVLLALVFVMIQTRSKEQWVKAEVKISSPSWWQAYYASPPFWLGESIKVGDKEFDPQGKTVTEVLAVQAYELSTLQQQEPARKDFYLTLNLRVDKDRRVGKLKFKNQPLEIGSPIELHFMNTYVPGIVTFIEGVSDRKDVREVIVEGVWLNNYPWNAEAIPIGGKMEDGMGNVVAEILGKEIRLAERTVETDWGGLVVSYDPLKRDIYLKVKLKVRESEGNLYFLYDKKVKIGENLFIQLPGIDIKWLAIKKIYDESGKRLY